METEDSLALLEGLVVPDPQVHVENRDPRAHKETLDPLVHLVPLVSRETLENLVLLE
jgi:hypothetical protein